MHPELRVPFWAPTRPRWSSQTPHWGRQRQEQPGLRVDASHLHDGSHGRTRGEPVTGHRVEQLEDVTLREVSQARENKPGPA